MTVADADLLDAIRTFQANQGYPPTWRELARKFNVQHSVIHYMLVRLRKDGKVAWEKGTARTLRVID